MSRRAQPRSQLLLQSAQLPELLGNYGIISIISVTTSSVRLWGSAHPSWSFPGWWCRWMRMAQIELAQHQIWAGSVGICAPQVPLQLVPCRNASCIPRCLGKGQLLPEDGKASVGEVPFPVNLSSRLCQHRHRLNSARMWLSCSAVCSAVQLSLSSEGEEFSGAAACAALLGFR